MVRSPLTIQTALKSSAWRSSLSGIRTKEPHGEKGGGTTAERAAGLYAAISGLKRVLVKAQVSKTWAWTFVPKGLVYDAKLIVFVFDTPAALGLLQSTLHWEWSLLYGTTLRQDMSYTPSTNFDTFPFPGRLDSLVAIGASCEVLASQDDGGAKRGSHQDVQPLSRQA